LLNRTASLFLWETLRHAAANARRPLFVYRNPLYIYIHILSHTVEWTWAT